MTHDNSFDEKAGLVISPAAAWKWALQERFFDEQIHYDKEIPHLINLAVSRSHITMNDIWNE